MRLDEAVNEIWMSDIELNKLREFYARYEDIEEVILYGSRA